MMFVVITGYPPTPNEFSDLYEKCIKTGKFCKYQCVLILYEIDKYFDVQSFLIL